MTGRPPRTFEERLQDELKHPAEALKDARGYMYKKVGRSLFVRRPDGVRWARWKNKKLPSITRHPYTIVKPRYPIWMIKLIAKAWGTIRAVGATKGVTLTMSQAGMLVITGYKFGFYIDSKDKDVKEAITEVAYRILELRSETLELRVKDDDENGQ